MRRRFHALPSEDKVRVAFLVGMVSGIALNTTTLVVALVAFQ